MKKIKLIFVILILALTVILSGCDVVYDYVLDDFLDEYGDLLLGDMDDSSDDEGDGNEDAPDGDVSDGEGDKDEDKDDDDVPPHVCEFSEWYTVTEATCEVSGISERTCGICFDTETSPIEKKPHTPIYVEGVEPTCTKDGNEGGNVCDVCDAIIDGFEPIPALGHIEVIDPAVPGTDTIPAKTEGKYCGVCGVVIVRAEYIYTSRYTDQESYSGDYAYNYIGMLNNGASMQTFYLEIREAVTDFHHSDADAVVKTTKNGEEVYMIGELLYSDNGLTNEEAIAVWCAFRFDHPLYYWMSNEISYNLNGGTVSILTYDEYASSEVRLAYNEAIYGAVKTLVEGALGEGDHYRIALSVHDNLLSGADYAYLEDGKTPSDEPFAHNIIGVMLEGFGVCESYAKSFQLLLNYFDIENVYVSGYANEPHAWNLVKLDDGQWYWFDLTWDDRPTWGGGIVYNYFCVIDSTNVNLFDGAAQGTPVTMAENHIPDSAGALGTAFFYTLPERSDSEFDFDTIKLRDEIIVKDGLSYVVCGFREVALIEIAAEGDVVIPETITYEGITFKVVMIGAFSDGLFRISGVVKTISENPFKTVNVTSVTIPSTVRFIWDNAFTRCNTIREFIVDEDNPYFRDYLGALFTKSLYTLIAYPFASEAREFVLPEQTREIAYYALGDGGNVLYAKLLMRLELGSNLLYVGVFGSVYGYRDSERIDESELNLDRGYLQKLYAMYPLMNIEGNF